MYLDSCCEAVLRAVENGITSRTTDDPELLGTPVVKHPDIIRNLDFHVHPHLLHYGSAGRLSATTSNM